MWPPCSASRGIAASVPVSTTVNPANGLDARSPDAASPAVSAGRNSGFGIATPAARNRSISVRLRSLAKKSRIPAAVNIMISRSIPIPMPPIGGAPNSRARRKSSSSCIASGSPAAAFSDWATSTSRWITGSISSEKPVPRSTPPMIRSQASTRRGSSGLLRASGWAIAG